MTAPVTGPYEWQNRWNGPTNKFGYTPEWGRIYRTWHRQQKPYNLPLPFNFYLQKVVSSSNTWDNSQEYYSGNGMDPIIQLDAYDKAYKRFVGKMGEKASLAVSMAEYQQSLNMIAKRAVQLRKFVRALRGLRFYEAGSVLGIAPADIRRMRLNVRYGAKSFGNNWLEFWFGWAPLVNDVATAVEVLQRPKPDIVFTATGSARDLRLTASNYQYKSFTNWEAKVKIGGFVKVTNPNLYLANQLGFVNPVTVALELVPFSWFANWFGTIQEFISGFTDFMGVELINPYVTRYNVTTTSDNWTIVNVPPSENAGRVDYFTYKWLNVHCYRTIGQPPGPTLRFRSPWRLSSTRALTASSLLLQTLKPGRN